MFFREIETERLLLKNISKEDNKFILKHFSDESVNKYLYDAEPLSNLKEADDIINFYLKSEPRAQHRWIIYHKFDRKKIGTCGFHFWDRANSSVDIGYDLQKEYWCKGIMSEALSKVLSFAVNEMNVKKINAHIYTDNIASISLTRKLGFTFNGETEICVFRGKEYLHHIYTLDRSLHK